MKWPAAWRNTVNSKMFNYAEPLAPSQYVQFPGEYAPPARGGWAQRDRAAAAWRSPLGTPSTGPQGGYQGWMRRTKWANQFLSPLYPLFKQFGDDAAAYSKFLDADGMQLGISAGWIVQCDISVGMPLYEYHSGGSLCTIGYFNAGHRWFDAFDPTPYGLIPGPQYWPGFGWYSVLIGQGQPHPLASPEIYNRRVEVHTATVGSPSVLPPPFKQVLPDPEWMSENVPASYSRSLPGVSHALPWRIANRVGLARPLPQTQTPGVKSPVVPRPPAPPVSPPKGRPDRVVRERKWRASGPLARALRIAGFATEAADFMEAAWWALSPGARKRAWEENGRKPLTPAERWWYAATHPGDINGEKLLQNLANNAMGDRVGGRAGRHTKEWHQANWSHGWDSRGRGPFENFNRLRDAVGGEGFGGGW